MNKLNACLKPGLLFLAFFFLVSASGLLHAGAPLKINFQGRLEESGQPAEGAKNFVFKLYDALSAGSLVWTSQAQSVAVTNGVFSVVLETGTPVNLSTAAFAGARYVEITVDGVPLSPRQEMVSAPYALVAQSLAPEAVISLSSLDKDPSSASVINTSTNAVDWTQLKNVPAGLADGTDDGGAVTFSTAAIVSGKFSDERVSISTGAFYGGFNAAYQLVQLDISGNLPALDGSALINVNSAPMSALTTQVNNVAASTGTLTASLAAVVLSTGPLVSSGNWNIAFGWGDHSSAGYVSVAALDSVKASTGTLTVSLAAVALSTGSLASQVNGVAASTGTLTAGLASVVLSTGGIAAQVSNVAASTGALTVNLAAVALSTGSLASQVNGVAASTGALTVNLAAVVLSTGPLASSGNWNTAFGWGNHASAGYAAAAALNSLAVSTGTLTVNLASVALSTGTLTVNLAAVVLSTGSIAAQVNGVAASTGTLTVGLAAVALSTGSIAAQVNSVAASTGTLTAGLAAVVLSTGPLSNSADWNTAFGWGDHSSAGYAGAVALDSVKASTGTLTVNLAAVALSTGSIAAQVSSVAASTGALTVNLAAVVLSTGPLASSGNWNTAFGWGNHASAGYAAGAALNNVAASTGTLNVSLAAVILSTGSIASQLNNVEASTGALTVNLAAVALSTGSIAAQVNNVAASTGTLTVNLAAVALSTGSIAAQVNSVAASTGTLTVNLAAVVLSTGPLANYGNWNTGFGWGDHAAAGYSVLGASQAFTGSPVFASTVAFTALNESLPGVTVSSGLVVAAGLVGLGTDSPNSVLSVGGSMSLPVRTISGIDSPYSVTANDSTIFVAADTGAINAILPSAAGIAGRIYTFKLVNDNFSVSIVPSGAETLDGRDFSAPFTMGYRGDFVTIQSDGTNWMIVGVYTYDLFNVAPKMLWP